MRPVIERQIDRFDLRKHVRITGFLSNQAVRQELQAARALVLPSFAEGLPVVIMESLAGGRPVISTYIAGIPELVEHGVNGWLVPAGAIESLVDAMAEALTADPADLERMGRSGAPRRLPEKHDVSIAGQETCRTFWMLRDSTPKEAVVRPGQVQWPWWQTFCNARPKAVSRLLSSARPVQSLTSYESPRHCHDRS